MDYKFLIVVKFWSSRGNLKSISIFDEIFFFGTIHLQSDFLCKFESDFYFWSELFQMNFKGISYVKWNYPPKRIEYSPKGIENNLKGFLM